MMALHSFAYAQARVQARYGDRLEDSDWQRLGAVRSAGQYLETARATSLRPWVAPLAPDMDHHQQERVLRAVWRDTVAEVSAWLPSEWRDAARVWSDLPELASIEHVRRGWFAPEWSERDDHLAEALPEAAGESAQNAGAAWLARWRNAWPLRRAAGRGAGGDRGGALSRLRGNRRARNAACLSRERSRYRPPNSPALFRRHAQTPAAIFAYLAFTWRDFERFRGGLIRRRLFHDGPGKERRMTLRPVPAQWFELVTTREELASVLDALARTGAVQLETFSRSAEALFPESVHDELGAYNDLAKDYRSYWPEPEQMAPARMPEPDKMVAKGVETLKAWAEDADPIIARLEELTNHKRELQRLHGLLDGAQEPLPRLRQAGTDGAGSGRARVSPARRHAGPGRSRTRAAQAHRNTQRRIPARHGQRRRHGIARRTTACAAGAARSDPGRSAIRRARSRRGSQEPPRAGR